MHSIPKSSRDDDLQLARAVAAGSTEAWHAFIRRYTPIIYSVLHKCLGSEDQVRDVYAEVLKQLYEGKAATYEGRAALSTWLVFVTRSVATDYLRRRNGRQLPSRCLDRLSALEQQVFTLFFEKERTLAEIRSRLEQEMDPPPTLDDIVDAIANVVGTVDGRTFKRLPHRRRAESIGIGASRLLEFLDAWTAEAELQNGNANPEAIMVAEESRKEALRILNLTKELSPAEQRLLQLRFDRRLSAQEIAAMTPGIEPRQVYRRLYRILAKLRNWAVQRGRELP